MHTTSALTKEFIESVKSSNPYYEKYSEKIGRVARTENPQKIHDRLQCYVESQREQIVPTQACPSGSFSEPRSSAGSSSRAPADNSERGLDSIMCLDKLDGLLSEHVQTLWREHFSRRDGLTGCMSAEQFHEMRDRWRQYRTFLLPLPRQQGYEFFLVQFSDKQAHFTPLISYQTHGPHAAVCLKLLHYDELAPCRQLVLMRGEFDQQLLTAAEARCLVHQLQLFYNRPAAHRLQLLEKFSQQPDQFSYQQLIDSVHQSTA